MRLPVLMSRQTIDDENRLFPGRCPPYWSPVAPSTGIYTYPSCSSTVNGAQAPVCPVYMFEPFSHVSSPNSPLRGIVWKLHSFLPVRTSKAIMSAFGNFIDFTTRAFSSEVGMMATLPNTKGGEVFIKWPMDGLKFASFSTCSVR